MSSIFGYFKQVSQGTSEAFKGKSTERKIFQREEKLSTEEKCMQIFLKQEFFAVDDQSFTDKSPPVRGWHGTSSKLLGNQTEKWELENKGKRFYFDSYETAKKYAEDRAKVHGGKPLVLKVSSPNEPKMNDYMNDRRHTGAYLYIPEGKDQKVIIKEVWEVKN